MVFIAFRLFQKMVISSTTSTCASSPTLCHWQADTQKRIIEKRLSLCMYVSILFSLVAGSDRKSRPICSRILHKGLRNGSRLFRSSPNQKFKHLAAALNKICMISVEKRGRKPDQKIHFVGCIQEGMRNALTRCTVSTTHPTANYTRSGNTRHRWTIDTPADPRHFGLDEAIAPDSRTRRRKLAACPAFRCAVSDQCGSMLARSEWHTCVAQTSSASVRINAKKIGIPHKIHALGLKDMMDFCVVSQSSVSYRVVQAKWHPLIATSWCHSFHINLFYT